MDSNERFRSFCRQIQKRISRCPAPPVVKAVDRGPLESSSCQISPEIRPGITRKNTFGKVQDGIPEAENKSEQPANQVHAYAKRPLGDIERWLKLDGANDESINISVELGPQVSDEWQIPHLSPTLRSSQLPRLPLVSEASKLGSPPPGGPVVDEVENPEVVQNSGVENPEALQSSEVETLEATQNSEEGQDWIPQAELDMDALDSRQCCVCGHPFERARPNNLCREKKLYLLCGHAIGHACFFKLADPYHGSDHRLVCPVMMDGRHCIPLRHECEHTHMPRFIRPGMVFRNPDAAVINRPCMWCSEITPGKTWTKKRTELNTRLCLLRRARELAGERDLLQSSGWHVLY